MVSGRGRAAAAAGARALAPVPAGASRFRPRRGWRLCTVVRAGGDRAAVRSSAAAKAEPALPEEEDAVDLLFQDLSSLR